MNLVPQNVSRTLARTLLKSKMNSPHIFFVGGVIGVVGSAVLACRATLKLEETLDDIQGDLQTVKDAYSVGRISEQEKNKHLVHVYAKSAVKVGKLYGPPIALGAASIAALTGSHIQMTRRNAALSATLTLVTQAFDEYRDRVREELGEDKELDIYRNVVTETVGKGENKELVKVSNGDGALYSRVFDSKNVNWRPSNEINRYFINCQQNYFNQRLSAYGHVFLNEIYDALGFERTQPGSVVGWVKNGDGDNYIDFGMYEISDGVMTDIALDFNVDGVIYNKI